MHSSQPSPPGLYLPGVHTILGARGSGKSRLARYLTRCSGRLILIDTLAEHAASGFVPEADLGYAYEAVTAGGLYRFGVVPQTGSVVEFLSGVAACRHGTTLFIDEIDYWYPSSTSPPSQGILDIARYGRHYDQSLVVVARQATAVHSTYRSQGTLWIFPMRGRGDCAYVRDVAKGYDPKELRVLERVGAHKIISEVARIDEDGVAVLQFNLQLELLQEK